MTDNQEQFPSSRTSSFRNARHLDTFGPHPNSVYVCFLSTLSHNLPTGFNSEEREPRSITNTHHT